MRTELKTAVGYPMNSLLRVFAEYYNETSTLEILDKVLYKYRNDLSELNKKLSEL